MKVSQARNCFLDFHRMNSKKNTMKNYELILSRFCDQFGERDMVSITQETVLSFLTEYTEGNKQSTKRLRFSLLSAFFNFIKSSIDPNLQNPCDAPILRKLFKEPKPIPGISWKKTLLTRWFSGQKIQETASCLNSWPGLV